MASRMRDALSMPAWLVASGLLVPPVFLPIILCVVDRAVEPSLPLPHLDAEEAERHLRLTAATVAATTAESDEADLVDAWQKLQAAELAERRSAGQGKSQLAAAQQAMREGCRAVASASSTERLFAVGDGVAIAVARAVARLEVDPEDAEREALEMGGGFLARARVSGLVDRHGRLRAHPIVPFALTQMSWRSACGLRIEARLTPIELDAVDVFRIQFGLRLPLETRIASVRRFASRHGSYPQEQALAALFLEAGDPSAAAEELSSALARSPRNLALRSYLLHAQVELE
jgi:hypothetical protein